MSREPVVTTRTSTVRTVLLLGTTSALVLGGAIASYMRDSILLAQIAALLAAFVLLPLALTSSIANLRRARHLLAGWSDLDAREAELDAQRAENDAQAAAIEERAAKVEKQYQILCGLVNERSSGASSDRASDPDHDGVRRALEEAMDELRRREQKEQILADRIRELESSRRRAEQELSRLMSESRERLQRERAISATKRERKLARAEEDATESLKVRSAAATEAEELLVEARGRAQALLEEAEVEAARLAAQGREEFESALRELRMREDEEIEKGGQILADARNRAAEIVDQAQKEAAALVEQGEAEFEALLEQIASYERREHELYERVRRLEQESAETGPGSLPTAADIESGSTGPKVGPHPSSPPGGSSRKPIAEATKEAQVPKSTDAPIAPAAVRESGQKGDHVVPDLVLLVDPPRGPIGAIRNLFGFFRFRNRSLDEESSGA